MTISQHLPPLSPAQNVPTDGQPTAGSVLCRDFHMFGINRWLVASHWVSFWCRADPVLRQATSSLGPFVSPPVKGENGVPERLFHGGVQSASVRRNS